MAESLQEQINSLKLELERLNSIVNIEHVKMKQEKEDC